MMQLILCLVLAYCYGSYGYSSSLFKDAEQVQFASSLKDYCIMKPKFSISRHVRKQRMSLETITKSKPERFYVKLRFNHHSIKLELRKNKNLLRKDFTLTDTLENTHKSYSAPNKKFHEQMSCYYSGHIINRLSSRVAISICDGLKGFISFSEGNYLIEPMRKVGRNFLHLIYESKAELNSTHNPMKGGPLSCDTGHYHREDDKDIASVDISALTAPIPPTNEKATHIINRRNNREKELANLVDLPVATIEVLIVLDQYMVSFHGNQSVQNYVLTMMNMVSDMYKDPSLGVFIDIVVTKVLLLHEDLENLHISHNGDKTLFSFCEWQFLQSIASNNNNADPASSYDVALLLTRKDVCAHSDRPCGTIGLAYIGGTCTTNRKCAVVEDIGLNTAYTIAHEIGHNLGMTHDGIDNDCKMASEGYPHMMASHWPTSNHVPLKWSYCSKKNLGLFLGSYKSYCIREIADEDSRSYYELSTAFPGKLYDADTQCRQQYGGVAKHCKNYKISGLPTDMCIHLWCEIEEEEECVSKLDPAAKGTECDIGKWCMYGKCVNNTSIPDSVDGGWSKWFNWTTCSRSCGVGVTYMERLCNNPVPRNGGRYCIGKSHRYQSCNTEACRSNSKDIRLLQCEQYNNKSIKYIPVHSESQPCALHCRPNNRSAHYSIRFQPLVIDGTPCKQGSQDICIDGRCEKLGCDLKLNSKLKKDICGVCGGSGDTCNLIEGEFTQPLGRGYVNAVDIPRDARNVLVQEVKPCASFLALKSGHGTYHVNGNWTIELPGKYNVNGTVVYYRRRGTQEFFFTEGPTKSKMHFMVLYQDFNFGVKFRYVLPLKLNITKGEVSIKKYKGSFGWLRGPWEDCSVVCGGGLMRRQKAACLHMYKSNISSVDDSLCSGAKRPPSSEKTCNEHECPNVWFVTPWTSCSKTCGLGRKKRIVSCKRQKPDGAWEERDPYDCSLAEKPVAIHTCVEKACHLSWKTSYWSKCRARCAKFGLKYRSVICPLPNACLVSLKPSTTIKCQSSKCDYQWIPKSWQPCSKTCGIGEQTRRLECREVNSFAISSGKCSWNRIPSTIRRCHVQDCDIPSTIKTTTTTTTTITPLAYTSTQPTANSNSISVIENVDRAPRRKRKPKSSYSPLYLDLVRKKKKSTNKSVHNVSLDNCKVDIMKPWLCGFNIWLSHHANKPFCDDPKKRLNCCVTCRINSVNKMLSILKRKKQKA